MGFFASTVANVLYGIHGASGDKRGTVQLTGLGGCFYIGLFLFLLGSMGKGNHSIPCIYPYCYRVICC